MGSTFSIALRALCASGDLAPPSSTVTLAKAARLRSIGTVLVPASLASAMGNTETATLIAYGASSKLAAPPTTVRFAESLRSHHLKAPNDLAQSSTLLLTPFRAGFDNRDRLC